MTDVVEKDGDSQVSESQVRLIVSKKTQRSCCAINQDRRGSKHPEANNVRLNFWLSSLFVFISVRDRVELQRLRGISQMMGHLTYLDTSLKFEEVSPVFAVDENFQAYVCIVSGFSVMYMC